ncbi:D-alanine--D-alanine ligase [Helicovermis profundi]|uniref:D-alanine--D-alanine ligase n=1 Tax=Helicovermis profundi TaxID=3065157 RepID=A0AAU9E6B2_9FIRM|nr:D-alanine--D-alanine ligase family protein [Clostridia bacterium S502]
MINLAVFFGSRSVEHEVSIITALQTILTLKENNNLNIQPIYIDKTGDWYTGDNLLEIDNFKNIKKVIANSQKINFVRENGKTYIVKSPLPTLRKGIISQVDMAFPIIHGSYGEDGSLQGFFEHMQIPYIGSSVLASATTMDKIITKLILKSSGVNVVDSVWFSADEWLNDSNKCIKLVEDNLDYPLIIKPSDIGSSIGVKVVKSKKEVEDAVNFVRKFSNRILAEKMIQNMREINISVLGDSEEVELSVCEEPISDDEFLTFDNKYNSNGSSTKGMSSAKREIPAKLTETEKNTIETMAKESFRALNLSGLCRIDFIMDTKEKKIYVNEFNTIPGSLAFYLWEATNKSFLEVLNTLIKLSSKKERNEAMLIRTNKSNILSGVKLGGLKK